MPRLFIILFLLNYGAFSLSAQNLIPNPDFEETDYCPVHLSLIEPDSTTRLLEWYRPTIGTPDCFNECGTGMYFETVAIPVNSCSNFQPTHSGDGYVGIITDSHNSNYREYIQGKLTDTLISGTYYYFEAWLAPATLVEEGASVTRMMTSDAMGVYFSNSRITDLAEYDTLGVDAHLNNEKGNFAVNPGGWTKMSGYYLAQGGETWITMGNFKSNLETDKISIPGYIYADTSYEQVYIFIDDMSLENCGGKFLRDTMICEGLSVTWNINFGEGDYLWSTGDTSRSITITTAGAYWLQYTDSIYTHIDTAIVTFHIDSTFYSSMDTTLCPDEFPFILVSPETYETYNWSNVSFYQSTNISAEGTYFLTSRLKCNTYIDTFHINEVDTPPDSMLSFNFTDTIMCDENWELEISGPNGFTKYLWSNGDTTQSTSVSEAGTYSLHYALPCFDFFDYIHILEDPYKNAILNLGEDIDLCNTENYFTVLNAGELPNYLWNTGETTQEIAITSAGEYNVSSFTDCKTLSDTILIIDCRTFNDNLILFPNPSFGVISISSENELYLPSTTFDIFSVQGKIKETHFDFANTITFDFTDFKKGYYLIRMISADKVYYFHLVLI